MKQISGFMNDISDEFKVIVVDAIDEADATGPPGVNRLYLPKHLPDGVVVVVSSRPQERYRLNATDIREVPGWSGRWKRSR